MHVTAWHRRFALTLSLLLLPVSTGDAQQSSRSRRSPLLTAQSAAALSNARKRVAGGDSAGAVAPYR